MTFQEAKKLHSDEEVLIIEKSGKNPIYRKEQIYKVDVEEKNVFVLCMDGHLYHHTALKAVSDT